MNKASKGSCPVITKAQYEKAREILTGYTNIAGEDIAQAMRKEAESCRISGGGYQRGGNRKQTIKRLIYVFMALGGANALAASTVATTLIPGFTMLLNGECGMIGNVTWRIFGLENPVCAAYNSMLATIARAIAGNVEAIALITGGVTGVGISVAALDATIDRIAAAIEAAMDTMLGAAPKALPGPGNGNRRNRPNGNGDPGGVALGGRRKTRSRKHTRKHKKGKHTRKH
jgi:hypothetical protein